MSGRFMFLTDDEQRKLILVQLYAAKEVDLREGGVPEDEIMALLEWADKARANDGLLENVLDGSAFVRMKGDEPELRLVRMKGDEPEFWLTPKGMAEGKALAEKIGLPTEGV